MSDEYVPTEQQNLDRWNVSESAKYLDGIPQLGQRFLDRYEVFGINNKGGFGFVFFVIDVKTDQKYAVKSIKPEFTDSFLDVEQFKSEIDTWISLEPHPNIAKAYFVEVIERRPYLFMEYVSGGVLRDFIGNLTNRQAVNLAYQVCLGMEFLNRKQSKIVHGDLKPENILVTPQGIPKLTDFGLAKPFIFDEGQVPRQLLGSLPYMSPEHLGRGILDIGSELLDSERLDERSDIFSFGILFYEMLEGRLPYPFNTQHLKSSEQWRDQLNKFYSDMDPSDFRADHHWSSPWLGIQGTFQNIVLGCILPYRRNRWRSFEILRQEFEFQFPNMIDRDTNENEGADLHQKALSLYRIGNLSKALQMFNQVLKKNPHVAELWRDAAIVLVDAEMLPTAKEFVARARKLDPNIDISDPKLGRLT
ncbi:MAG: protein kinase [Anaerolineales bacterium]|nr:protein kinase [Anaerolineales bacterium]